jgi:nitroimidazol reductase NimA-like FMN-containing flavoprotein (pyridoxamine 5'-phosphate oxidase superfamily)
MMSEAFARGGRSIPRRKPERVSYDEAAVHAILDSALVAHVGYLAESGPVVTPTAFWRVGRRLYWHGSAVARSQRAPAGGIPLCLTVTLVDGLVLGRSGFVHSLNYRSVMAFGRGRPIEDLEARRAAMDLFLERLYPGRTAELRPATPAELKQISVVEMTIEEATAKVRGGGVRDLPADAGWSAWSGVVPLTTRLGRPQPEGAASGEGAVPASLAQLEGERLDEALLAWARRSKPSV